MSHGGSRSRRSLVRRPGHDYSAPGWYFVTICARERRHVFGEVTGGRAVLSPVGELVDECLRDLSEHYPHVSIEARVIMPDHVHAVIKVGTPGGLGPASDDRGADNASIAGDACLALAPGRPPNAMPAAVDAETTGSTPSAAGDAGVAPTMGDAGMEARATHASRAPSPSASGRGEACLARASGGLSDAIASATVASEPTGSFISAAAEASLALALHDPTRVSLGAVVGSFKAAVSRRLNAAQGTRAATVWQRGFHDHVIRSPAAFERARRYIEENPARWEARTAAPPH